MEQLQQPNTKLFYGVLETAVTTINNLDPERLHKVQIHDISTNNKKNS
jgi:hypothetical protein